VTELLNLLPNIRRKIKKAFAENWGFPFIAGFLALLLAAAVLLSMGLVSVAELIATCAYFALVIGVVLQLVGFGKNKLKGVALHESS
jgi:hypothetical protein